MTRGRVERGPRDGYILVAVLGTMLLLTSFMAAGSLLVRSALDTARLGDSDVAMAGLTQSGVELTAYQLFVIKAAPDAINGRRIKFTDGSIAPLIDDEGGKADLNGSDSKLLASLFQSVGLSPGVASGLVAYILQIRGPDRNPSTDGAPSRTTSQPTGGTLAPSSEIAQQSGSPTPQPGPAGAKKTPRGFQSVDQLADFPELTRSDLRALRPVLTVFNPDGKINIRSASRAMLAAIPGVASADVELVLSRRTGADKKQIDALLSSLQNAKSYVKATFGPAFAVRIDATSATGRKKAIHAVVAASKSADDPYYVLDWWE